jgi:hypothetical protein
MPKAADHRDRVDADVSVREKFHVELRSNSSCRTTETA